MWNNSIASSPLILAGEEAIELGDWLKKVKNFVDSVATVYVSPAFKDIAGNVNSSPSVPPPLLAEPNP